MKKILLSILACLTVFLSSAPYLTVSAATPTPTPASQTNTGSTWYSQNPFEWYVKVYDEDASPPNEIFGERYTAAQVQWVFYSVVAYVFNLPFTILGLQPLPWVYLANVASGTVKITSNELENIITTFSTAVEKLIPEAPVEPKPQGFNSENRNFVWKKIFTENRSFSGISYIRGVLNKFKSPLDVNAAPQTSFGFSRLTIITDLWKICRNIAYFFFVIVAVITAFLVMFKVKISPQAVVTIQSALPKTIATLLLVTFSYAIAGFLVDLMYVLMGLFSVFLSSFFGNVNDIYLFLEGSTAGNIHLGGSIAVILYSMVYLILFIIASLMAWTTALVNLNAGGIIVSLILLVFTIILLIILIVNVFKIIAGLYKALAGFYLGVIIGPIQLAVGALPNSRGALGKWLLGLVSKLLVFPATGALYYIAIILLGKSIVIGMAGILYLPAKTIELIRPILSSIGVQFGLETGNLTSLWAPPLLGEAGSASAIAFILMSLSCIMLIPKVSKTIESAFAGRPFDYESAIGEPVTSTARSVWGATGAPLVKGVQEKIGRDFADERASRAVGFISGLLGSKKAKENERGNQQV